MNKYLIDLEIENIILLSDEHFSKNDWVLVSYKNNIRVANILNLVENDKGDCAEGEILRLATDIEVKEKEREIAQNQEIMQDCQRMANGLGLKMRFLNLVSKEKENLLIFNFYADSRVDFRELARKAAGKYKKRIELHQIGARDKAKMIGGLAPCGLFLCCTNHLVSFESISINMAKNQMLALNPNKINGQCGRLLCCLNYEDETYTILKSKLPRLGEIVKAEGKSGKVIELNIFKNSYVILTKDNERVEVKNNA